MLEGEISAIASKSDAHRVLICAALSSSPCELILGTSSEDIEATARCMRALGATIEKSENGLKVTPGKIPEEVFLDCGESGSTLRFLLPVAAALCERASFTGQGRLPERPIGELMQAMEQNEVSFSAPKLPLETHGKLKSGVYTLPGNISSQYITGLLLALPLLEGDSEIVLTTSLESAAYVDITLHALRRFGIEITKTQKGYFVRGGQKYKSPEKVRIDGDWSNAAFFLVAGAIGRTVTVTGLDMTSPQGDKKICEILRLFGADVCASNDKITVSPAPLKAQTVDMTEIPDMLPALAVLAANAEGESVFTGAQRLRIKESDRLKTICEMISSLGGECRETEDGIAVTGRKLAGGKVIGSGDHRIVMAAAAAATACADEVVIDGAQAVRKSYPTFFEDFARLGGEASVI